MVEWFLWYKQIFDHSTCEVKGKSRYFWLIKILRLNARESSKPEHLIDHRDD